MLYSHENFVFLHSITGIVVRQIADLLSLMPHVNQILTSSSTVMEITQDDIYNVQVSIIWNIKFLLVFFSFILNSCFFFNRCNILYIFRSIWNSD